MPQRRPWPALETEPGCARRWSASLRAAVVGPLPAGALSVARARLCVPPARFALPGAGPPAAGTAWLVAGCPSAYPAGIAVKAETATGYAYIRAAVSPGTLTALRTGDELPWTRTDRRSSNRLPPD